jgi:hypothetical protein
MTNQIIEAEDNVLKIEAHSINNSIDFESDILLWRFQPENPKFQPDDYLESMREIAEQIP